MNDALLVLVGDPARSESTQWPLVDGSVLGRSPDAAISFDLAQLSRAHARFERTATGWAVVDLGSHNGTFIDGEPVTTEPRVLLEGDVLVFAGVLSLRFTDPLATPMAPRIGRLHGLWIDPDTDAVWVDARLLEPALSPRQLTLLRMLDAAQGEVVERAAIVETVWSDVAAEGVSDQAIDGLIKRLRARLHELDTAVGIDVVRGRGLRLQNPDI